MNRIKLVIVDLDMTLVDTARQCYEILINMINARHVTFNEFMQLYYDGRGIRRGLAQLMGEEMLSYGFWRQCWLRYVEGGKYGTLLPGALEALREIKGEGRLIVIATGREIESRLLTKELANYGLLNLVDDYLSLGDIGPQHGKDELLRRLIAKYNNGNVKGSVYVTDHPKDISICKSMGMLSIGVLNEWVKELKADKVIRELRELPRAIRELEESMR